MNEESIRVEDIVYTLKSRWMIIVGMILTLTIASTVLSFFVIKPKYEAKTKLFIGKEDNSEKAYSSSDVQMYQNLLKTYSDTIKTKDLVDRALNNINSQVSVNEVLGSLNVTPNTGTQILVISYTSVDKRFAKDIVESISNEFVKTSTELISNVNVKIIESVELPESPVSPNKKLNIVIAIILGFIIGVAISLILEVMDNTFKDKNQIEAMLGIPVIGTIPDGEQ